MFTWICPKCGREVPPSYDDCPNCTAPAQPAPPQPAAAPQYQPAPAPPPPPPAPAYGQPAPPPPPSYSAPQQGYAPAPPYPPQGYPQPPYEGYAQQPQGYPAAPKRKMPEWLVMVLVAIGSVGLFALAYFYLLPSSRKGASNGAAERPAVERKAPGAKEHPYAKFLDVTGVRLIEDAKQNVQVKFLVVNHSAAEMGGVTAEVILKPVNAKPDTPPITQFSFKLPTLGGYESREVTVPAKTALRAYEMPDWQFLQSEVHIAAEK